MTAPILDTYLTGYDPAWFGVPECRRILTRDNPLLFALTYLPHHLKDQNGRLSLSGVHEDWIAHARHWISPNLKSKNGRHAYIAPRSMGKSTWWQLILPLWAAAHGHVDFIAGFASAASQARQRLRDIKHELETNPLLRADYPTLCAPAKRSTGASDADRQDMYVAASGAAFTAQGIDSSVLGAKVGSRRPGLIILDDVEPGESMYSQYQMEKRLKQIQDDILPLNDKAHVVLVGTVTMPGSITHQLVKAADGREIADWITEEQIHVHHYKPILTAPDGTEYSVWPEKWPMDFLNQERHFRSFAKNFANDPMGYDGKYWSREDFRHGQLDTVTKTLLSIDPAVTAKESSDYTGLAVVGYSPLEKRCVIKHTAGVRLIGKDLRDHVISLLERFPEIRVVRVEANQAGDLWHDVFHHLPGVKVITHTSSASKEVRFAQALDWWQRGRVLHAQPMPVLEEQAVGFPEAAFDDVIDAAVAGVAFFLQPNTKTKAGHTVRSYV
ncbi:hypothetical protein [Streptomyces ortus]|uniref:Terminase large subunit gp17-like C-terminal domain-containing protein n=1 Tax=Streptomyces ortus TaxID=2867268 RepID=A0ABT3UZN2_9ACTN|nr:hypothetical protein [Streptomyces ortus]MCX4232817.1 hypothetical protein [Streptomyces ortus]